MAGIFTAGFFIIILIIFLLFAGLRRVFEYDRLVRFRLGKYKDTMKPGLRWIIPILDTTKKVDIRVITLDIPKQEAMTSDNVPVHVDAVVFFKIVDPRKSIIDIENVRLAIMQYSQTVLRDIIGKNDLDSVLSHREKVANEIKKIVDTETDKWGVDVSSVRVQNIELPETMKRAMARQAEAERERRATVIKSQGEIEAAENLMQAAKTMEKAPMALQLRTLGTLADISSDPSQKIILPIPFDILDFFKKKK
ncbi:slipin family protein [Nanoarchaeota archaeon]